MKSAPSIAGFTESQAEAAESRADAALWDRVSIAPMMDITDRRFRYFMRLLNSRVRLYTEMIVCHAIVRGDRERLLAFDTSQHPVVLQLGGDDPQIMAEAARIGEAYGYDGIDINCGCPSNRVESGNFGVCLMRSPDLVARIVVAIRAAVKIKVSVKCRIGITGEYSEKSLHSFAQSVFDAGVDTLTVHARTATIGGLGVAHGAEPGTKTGALSPKQNREIPPLQYDVAYALKQRFPGKPIEINGGIKTVQAIRSHLQHVDRVMIGRLAHEDPYFFQFQEEAAATSRIEILEAMAEYAARHEKPEMSAAKFFSNMLNLFHGIAGARLVRRYLSEQGRGLSPQKAVAGLREQQIVD